MTTTAMGSKDMVIIPHPPKILETISQRWRSSTRIDHEALQGTGKFLR